jgi:predicted nucleic acid-binding protein
MYAGGGEHPLRSPCVQVLEIAARAPREFWTDAEVLQEILHRYLAIGRWTEGRSVFAGFVTLMGDRIEPVYRGDVELAAADAGLTPGLSARDLLHLAVMNRRGTHTLVSADRAFDHAQGISRLDPAETSVLKDQVERR